MLRWCSVIEYFASIAPEFWWGVLLSGCIAVASTLWKRFRHADEYFQMNWMDWCGNYAVKGIITIFVGGFTGSYVIMSAGAVLLLPFYPLAILGLLGKADDIITDIARAIRKR